MTWVYILSAPGLWTVGFYDPEGKWHPDSDYNDYQEAARRCHWLNGGQLKPSKRQVKDPLKPLASPPEQR